MVCPFKIENNQERDSEMPSKYENEFQRTSNVYRTLILSSFHCNQHKIPFSWTIIMCSTYVNRLKRQLWVLSVEYRMLQSTIVRSKWFFPYKYNGKILSPAIHSSILMLDEYWIYGGCSLFVPLFIPLLTSTEKTNRKIFPLCFVKEWILLIFSRLHIGSKRNGIFVIFHCMSVCSKCVPPGRLPPPSSFHLC